LKQAQDQQTAAVLKKTNYDKAIKQGKEALASKKFDEAIAAFKQADMQWPGDATAAALLKDAEKARNDATLEQQRIAQFNQLMKDGNSALAAKKYAEAVKHYTDATKLSPTDVTAANALKEANRQWEVSKTPPGPTAAQIAEYTKQMTAGATFDQQKKWDEAMKAYEAALKQIPKDTKATEALNKSTYHHHITEGDKAYTARRFPDAIREYEAALKLYPNDQDATKALKKAKDAK
jgi:tetratricopeptide (TPR) repeat protein